MTTGFQKMMESQQGMLDQWMDLTKEMFTPFWETTSSQASTQKKGKNKKKQKAGETNWVEAMSKFWGQWLSAADENTRRTMEAYRGMMGMTSGDTSPFDMTNVWKESARFWTSWMESGQGQSWPGNYNEWSKEWLKLWEAPLKAGGSIQMPFSTGVFQKPIFNLLESYPADQWCNFLARYNEFLESYIDYVDDIDLPFDEMAASWEKMLEVYTPQDNMPFSVLGESMSKYVELMIYPLYGVVEPPQIMAMLKMWYAVRFYTLSFLIRNVELRGMVLEASLAAWPEALKSCNEQYEENGNTPTIVDFYQEFFNKLEEHLHELMKSDDYVQVQEKIVETMVTLKSRLNKWFEIGTASLPLVTQSDLNDIARELEALRIKMRKMSKEKSAATLINEAMN